MRGMNANMNAGSSSGRIGISEVILTAVILGW